MKKNDTVGFIGCGNMGGALIRAAAKAIDPERILIADALTDKVSALANETGSVPSDLPSIAGGCRYIFLGVKPQGMQAMLDQIRDVLAARKDRFTLVTMAAGMTMERILSMAGGFPIIRIMPNLPASVGEGMILWCSRGASAEEEKDFERILSRAGKLLKIPEHLIDAGSAVSGCGPAYVFQFAEALADGGVRCGLSRADANLLAAQTLLGSAKLLLESGLHPGVWKDAVCSPGGTTIEGVLALEEGAFRSDVSKAVIAAYEKTKKL